MPDRGVMLTRFATARRWPGEQMEARTMQDLAAHEGARRIGATLGVIGTLALAYYYLLVPLLTVPTPASYVFHAAWLVLLGLSIFWWRRHPWRSLAVPIVGFVAALAVLWFGSTYLGWAP